MKKYVILFVCFALSTISYSQVYKDWDDYTIDEFYVKQELPYGSLDEDGDDISYVYVQKRPKKGVYSIEITDGDGDLYEVKGTGFYIKFRTYFGYAGYAQEGVLVVGTSSWSSYFYKKE